MLTNVISAIAYFCPMKKTYCFLLICSGLFWTGCNSGDGNGGGGDSNTAAPAVPILSYSIISTHPHDTSYFTEGLEFYHNTLLESTGNYGSSKLVQLDHPSGRVLKEVNLDPRYFGEGITVLNDTLYQLTYKEQEVLVYNAKDFRRLSTLPFKGEGWGLTNNGKEIIASNGTSTLYFHEPGTFNLIRQVNVTEAGSYVTNINELEYVNGFVYANQWQYPYILKIDPATGTVVAKLDLSDMVSRAQSDGHSEHFNGIAYNPSTNKFYVTGKYWKSLYEIQFER